MGVGNILAMFNIMHSLFIILNILLPPGENSLYAPVSTYFIKDYPYSVCGVGNFKHLHAYWLIAYSRIFFLYIYFFL